MSPVSGLPEKEKDQDVVTPICSLKWLYQFPSFQNWTTSFSSAWIPVTLSGMAADTIEVIQPSICKSSWLQSRRFKHVCKPPIGINGTGSYLMCLLQYRGATCLKLRASFSSLLNHGFGMAMPWKRLCLPLKYLISLSFTLLDLPGIWFFVKQDGTSS